MYIFNRYFTISKKLNYGVYNDMQEQQFLLSIIIPTRNRQKYAVQAVRQIECIDKRIQIIVHDNSDDNCLEGLLGRHSNNIIYKHVAHRISAVENYNMAASYATGRYFMALGDDDTILPNIIECIEWMEKNKIDAVKPSKYLSYNWPNSDFIQKKQMGYLWIERFSGNVQLCDTKDTIKVLLGNGGQGYLDLPMVGSYHCIVTLKSMKRIYAITGKYYGGCSPDIYSAVCLSLLDNIKCVEIDFPVTLPGVCPTSTSADAMLGKHSGKLEEAPQFIGMLNYQWEEMIPRYYTVETVWAETALKAIKDMGKSEYINNFFDRGRLIDHMIKNNYLYDKEVMNFVNLTENKKESYYNVKERNKSILKLRKMAKSIFSKLEIISGRRKVFYCRDIEKAVEYVNSYLCTRNNKTKWNKIMGQNF